MKSTITRILLIAAVILVACAIFFIFSTTLSSPTTMAINIPKVEPYESKYPDSKTKLTILLHKNDLVYGYYGNDINAGRSIPIKKARSLLQEALAKFTNDSLIVIIKPGIEATYQNTVDMLDEMTINKIKRFEMSDLNKEESKFLDEKKIK